MYTRVHKHFKKRKTKKIREGKKWITAINAATETFKKTGNLFEAKKSFKRQAFLNSRKLFGSIGKKV